MSTVPQTVEYVVRADRPVSLDPRDPATPTLADVARAELVMFDITTSDSLILGPLVATASLDRTIDGASTLKASLIDADDTLIRHRLMIRNKAGLYRGRVVLDSLVFHLVGVGRPGARRVDLTFEAQGYSALRRHNKPIVASRGAVTRAQFVKRLCDEAGLDLVSPELMVKQRVIAAAEPVATGNQSADHAKSAPARDRAREPGFSRHASLTIKGQAASSEQRANLALSLSVARGLGAGPLATLSMVTAGIGESEWRKSAAEQIYGTHKGVFQSNQIPAKDLKAQTIHFLTGGRSFLAGGAIGYAKAHPGTSPGTIAAKVEISDGSAKYYDSHAGEARRIIAAYTGGAIDSAATAGVLSNDAPEAGSYAVPYEFHRGDNGTPEDSVTCIKRLAGEVAWYFFESAGTAYFVSGDYLIRSRARMLVAPGAKGIELVTFSCDESAKLEDSITVVCRARRWQAPPGSVVDVDGYGDADGRWLVGQISRPKLYTSDLATITLVPPVHPLPEPAHEVAQRAATDQDAPSDGTFNVGGGTSASGRTVKGGAWTAPAGGAHSFHGPKATLLNNLAGIGQNTYKLRVTATTNGGHVTGSYHYSGRAFDIAGSESQMHAFSAYCASNYTSELRELIHNPGFGVKDGRTVNGAAVFAKVWAGHRNHVHVAA